MTRAARKKCRCPTSNPSSCSSYWALCATGRFGLQDSWRFYDPLSQFLLFAIGLKGGVELARHPLQSLVLPALAVVVAGSLILPLAFPLLAFPILRRIGKLPAADAGAIAAHYSSVSVVTFALGSTYVVMLGEFVERYMVVLPMLLKFLALMIVALLARRGEPDTSWRKLPHELRSSPEKALCCCSAA